MAKKYIDADKAIEAIVNCTDIFINNLPVVIYKTDAQEAIYEVPAADVRENVRGEWIEPNGVLTSLCSECGFINNSAKWKFCPNCGADMRRQDG